MHIIITDAWMARRQAIHLNGWKLIAAAVLSVLMLMLGAVATYHWVFLEGIRQGWPGFTSVGRIVHKDDTGDRDAYLRANIDAMARKLGEMQARLMQVESLGERVSGLAGLEPAKGRPPLPGSGGVLVANRSLTLEELSKEMDALDEHSDAGIDWLTAIESRLFDQRIQRSLVPTQKPVEGVRVGSPFGFRIDPITGQKALHTGLDFPADVGTPILAAAGGVVIAQEFHAGYGNLVEIDHGNDLVTRYAHTSRVFVKKGDIVKRGQKIAEVGSTGRSTGPHLHFEVWVAGVAQNPQKFLKAGEALAQHQPQTKSTSR
ncbi:MAG: M23 family metallopeptidase [Hydrogenophaga sp.]|uniref:M23 family metallopeptidase n=1 Tax=Hydrogenophaga sp. TaxID=1904254 RepID=UPI001DA092C9|nr:M23 family metallopeptidase [Hydrogenophaga sp.]MBX3611719.1 M23 family metallopeptidase [Hydrogenophaga sp.]